MAAKRIYQPSVLIDSVEYKCKARSVKLTPGDWINYCEQEWTFEADIEIGYGVSESWTDLDALRNTIVSVVLKPEDAVIGAGNPEATFQITMPAIPFMDSSDRGERQVISLSVLTESEPVIAIV